jgi:dephospho-CoA kinase
VQVVGLTGSIGSGKSTTAAMFRARGVPVHDADASVHQLYEGGAVAAIERSFAGVTVAGKVDRGRLAERVVDDPPALARLEAIVHPLVRESQAKFLAREQAAGRRLVVLDIPLLFEAGHRDGVDTIVAVAVDDATRRARVLARPGMTKSKLDALESRQLPDRDKRRSAHFVIDSGHGFAAAGREVDAILRALAFAL